jgi:hypothetical protein
MPGMQERAAVARRRLAVWSEFGSGTGNRIAYSSLELRTQRQRRLTFDVRWKGTG